MSLKNAFAKTLNGMGIHPLYFLREQLADVVTTDNVKTLGDILKKFPSASIMSVPDGEDRRAVPAFESAVARQNFNVAALLVKTAPLVLTTDYSKGETSSNRTILMQRVISGDAPEIDFLIAQGVNVRAKDTDGNTALHLAAASDRRDSMDKLLAAGAFIHARNNKGETPLMAATQGFSDDAVKHLIGIKAVGLESCDNKGRNATMHAMHNHNVVAATFLMQQGGVVNLQDPVLDTMRRVATDEAAWDFLRLLNSQHDIERNRLDDVAKLSMKQICETGIAGDIKVRKPFQLKTKGPQDV